jgi:hypothetical protein
LHSAPFIGESDRATLQSVSLNCAVLHQKVRAP